MGISARPADPAEYRDATGDADQIDRALNDPESIKAVEKAAVQESTTLETKESTEIKPETTQETKPETSTEDWKSKYEALRTEADELKSANEKALKSVEWSKRVHGKLSEQLRNAKSGSRESQANEETEGEDGEYFQPERPAFSEAERIDAEWNYFFAQNPRLISREKALGDLLSAESIKSDSDVAECISYLPGSRQIDVSKTLKNANRLLTERATAKASEKAGKVAQTVAQAQSTAAASGAPVRSSGFSAESNPFEGVTEEEMLDNPQKYYAEHTKAMQKAGMLDKSDLPRILRSKR